MPRCFVAILLDEDLRAAVAAEVDRLRPLSRAVAWVPAENLHLTLRFLGNQDEARISEAIAAMEEALGGLAPFTLGLAGVGGFPDLGRPRVLWVGASDGAAAARAVQGAVEGALERRGFGREPRAWHPHVTIGRVFDQRRWRRDAGPDLLAAVAAAHGRPFGAFAVASVALMRSDLSPSGARYRELARVRLAA